MIKGTIIPTFMLSLLPMVAAAQTSSEPKAAELGQLVGSVQPESSTEPTIANSDFDILSCPFDIFREAYVNAVATDSRLAVMALEDEAINACAKRQATLNRILANEQSLRELLLEVQAPSAAETTLEAATAQQASVAPVATAATSQPPNPIEGEDAASVDVTTPDPDVGSDTDASNEPGLEPTNSLSAPAYVGTSAPTAACRAEFAVQLAGHQRYGDGNLGWATLQDADGNLHVVQQGDRLAGGLSIVSVKAGEVKVKTAEGATERLPHVPQQIAAPIDGGFYYTITPLEDLYGQPKEGGE